MGMVHNLRELYVSVYLLKDRKVVGNLGPSMIQMILNNGQILVVAEGRFIFFLVSGTVFWLYHENSVGYIKIFWLLPRSAYPKLRTSVSHILSVSRSTRN